MDFPRKTHADQLQVRIYGTRMDMGQAAGKDAAAKLRSLLAAKAEVNVIFAAAPSQNEILAALAEEPEIDWNRVNAFHMDEYLGLEATAPQCFSNYLTEHIFSKVPFRKVFRINPSNEAEAECKRYTELLEKYPVDLVCLGIGENGHIAFNDPGVAKFDDPSFVKVAELDLVCRTQQVHDGCFASVDQVPTHALTLTIPALTRAAHMICVVPGSSKRWAVKATVFGPITEALPASILRLHSDAVLYCDQESGMDIL